MARTEKIVLCKMFTGNYWEDENNLGYETINMFIPDDQALAIEPISYMYLPANGDYKLEDHKITHVLLVRSVPDTDGKVVQIIGKAEVAEEGELLWDKEKNKSMISKCIGGKEFVGLHNLVKIFKHDIEKDEEDTINDIDIIEVENNIAEIAACYGKETPKNNEDYFNLAVDLGFRNDINRKLPDNDLHKLMDGSDNEQEKDNAKNWFDQKENSKYELNPNGRGKVEGYVKTQDIKVANPNAPTEYNYWYAKKKDLQKKNLSQDILMSIVKEYQELEELKKLCTEDGENYKLNSTAKKHIKNKVTEKNLKDPEYNYKYAEKCLGENVLESLLDGAMSKESFCKLVKAQYNLHANALRGIFTSLEQNKVRDAVYGGLTYDQIFKRNKHYGLLNICASLQVKNLYLVDENSKLYLKRDVNGQLYLSQNKDKKIDSDNDIDLEKKIDQKKLSATSQTVFIPSDKNMWEKICEQNVWVRSQPLRIENTPYLEDSYLTVAKHEYDELTYSNLFAYFFKKSPEFAQYFFAHVKLRVNENNEYKSLIEGISTTKGVSAETVEISDEDWKKLKAENEKATVKREEKNIDIVLRTEDKVIVIENKIKSALNGKEITGEAVNSQSQEDSSSNGKNTNNKLTFKDQLMRYYQYIERKYPTGNDGSNKHYFIFAPDYNPIENEHFGEVNGKKMEEVWKVVPYSAIFEGIKDYHIDEDDNLKNDFDKNLFKEFLKALYVHTDSSANNYYRQMQKRLMRIKAENDKKNKQL